MTVWQPSSDKLWEFFHMRRLSDGWHAAWGGAIQHVSQNPGYYPPPLGRVPPGWGAARSGLPDAAGGSASRGHQGRRDLSRARGQSSLPIPGHLLGGPRSAQERTGTAANCIPEGAHLRINPSLDVEGSIPSHPPCG